MFEHNFSYREVIPDQTVSDAFREISLTTGGTQSILQDIKIAERAGGFCYQNSFKHTTRNRFISWRINHDVLELTEQSLDVNLSGNKIRYKFIDTPVLDGISINETPDNIVILVATVCSVHRLTFQHPNKLHRQEELRESHPDLVLPSIFSDATASQARTPSTFFVFNSPSSANQQLPHAATSTLTPGELTAHFLLAYPMGELLLIKQSKNGSIIPTELNCDRMVSRFLSGIADKFRSKSNDSNVVVSMLLHTIGLEVYAFTLCRDGHLKVWSCSKGQCIAVNDLLSETADNGTELIQSAHNHTMRKALGNDNNELILVVYMSFVSESQFHVFKPTINGMQFSIIRLNSLYSPGTDLIDFNLTLSRIWSLWRNEEGETNLYTATLNGHGEGTHWIPVLLEPVLDVNNISDTVDVDPRQLYLQQIFYPGRFPLHIINKALSIYKRSPVLNDPNLSLASLKHRVSVAVENEIQNELKEMEVIDEDYLECAMWAWSKFYSCCVQYYTAGLRPLGLLLLPCVSGVVLLKKSLYSFLRPLDALEHLMLCSDYVSLPQFIEHPLLGKDLNVTEYVISLMNVVVYLEQQLSDEFKATFEKELSHLRSPDIVMSELITDILTETDEQFSWTISQRLNECKDIYQAMHKLFELLRIEPNYMEEDEVSEDLRKLIRHMFSSSLGVSVTSQCVRQQAALRFTICRNLLVIHNILIERGEQEWNTLEAVRSVCLPEIVVLIQSSYATMYISDLSALQVTTMENTVQAMTPLNLTPAFNLKTQQTHSLSLVALFIQSSGGFEGHKNLSKEQLDQEKLPHWHTSLLSYVTNVFRLIWPISGDPLFAEWLLSSGQGVWLQQYVRVLNNWCEWNNCTRNFLLAVSLLGSGEYYKAMDLFQKSAKGVFTDQFLADRILGTISEDTPKSKVYVHYFLKVIQLFELHGARDYAIKIAVSAITIADQNDPNLATLYSLKFVHNLALGHYEEAYNALNGNPDKDRKKDNLRDLIKVLLEKKQLDVLLSFPYKGLRSIFASILFARARACEPINNVYYDLLYCYCIKLGPAYMRKAAMILYEQAFRLQESTTVEGVEKQVKCYLATINGLNLCEAKYAWVDRPVTNENGDTAVLQTLPQLAGSDDEPITYRIKKEVEIIELPDIKKEYYFASAKLTLVKFNQQFSIAGLNTPTELAILMASVGLFKQALMLSAQFDLNMEPIFEQLTKKCVNLGYTENPESWNWLIENDLQDFKVISNTPSIVAWELLRSLIDQYEEAKMTTVHKVVCSKIIRMSAFIPQWLITSYKKRNCGELIRILYVSGRLHEAVDLAVEYLKAALGDGKEFFGIECEIRSPCPQFCMPIHVLENLIYELQLQNEDNPKKPFKEEYTQLRDVYVKYLKTCKRITRMECNIQAVA